MTSCILFPHHLFQDVAPLRSFAHVYLVEEPMFFYDPQRRPFLPNKVKLAYMVACMTAYRAHLTTRLPRNTSVQYIPYDQVPAFYKRLRTTRAPVHMYDPTDHDVLAKYRKLTTVTLLPRQPQFLLTPQDLSAYHSAHPAAPRHASFYAFVKKRLNLLQGVRNYDTENRLALPATFRPTPPPQLPPSPIAQAAARYVDGHPIFRKALGSTATLQLWPITHEGARQALARFIRSKLANFGAYEDAVHSQDAFLYHSAISPMLNNGLLTPQQVVQAIQQAAPSHHPRNIEGFLRQVIGWREYMRYLYIHRYTEMTTANHFRLTRTFTAAQKRAWTEGTTGIPAVDQEIQKAVRYGYAHHIVRLMVFLNLFILLEFHPKQVYQWFMEVISMDAYDWVMKSNIWAMGYYYPHAMMKPYLSTSNYLNRMSDYKKDAAWDALFHRFLVKHEAQLQGGAAIYLRNLAFSKKFVAQSTQKKGNMKSTHAM